MVKFAAPFHYRKSSSTGWLVINVETTCIYSINRLPAVFHDFKRSGATRILPGLQLAGNKKELEYLRPPYVLQIAASNP